MSTLSKRILAWWKYVQADVKPADEDPAVLAGRGAEDLLRSIVDSHFQFKNCHSFSSKRVFDPSVNHKREIDLIVVTHKRLYVLECKNWGGHLRQEAGNWVQYKRQGGGGTGINHGDVVKENQHKLNALLGHLRDKGISISESDCVQRVILMNQGLSIDPVIKGAPGVISADQLKTFLSQQSNRLTFSERLFASLISLLLDQEASNHIVGDLYKLLGKSSHQRMLSVIAGLPTWDKVYYYGNKILSGDVRAFPIYSSGKPVGTGAIGHIDVGICRSKGWFFVKSLFAIGHPVNLDLYDGEGKWISKEEGDPDGHIRFQPAGSPSQVDIPLYQVIKIVFGTGSTSPDPGRPLPSGVRALWKPVRRVLIGGALVALLVYAVGHLPSVQKSPATAALTPANPTDQNREIQSAGHTRNRSTDVAGSKVVGKDNRQQARGHIEGGEKREIDLVRSEIQKKIAANWFVPPGSGHLSCGVVIYLARGGEIARVRVIRTSGDQWFDRSVVNAVYKSAPLPVPRATVFEPLWEVAFDFSPGIKAPFSGGKR